MYFVIRTFPGSGKTTSVMMAIDQAGFTWIYLAPTHEVINENLEYSKLRDYEFIHLKGKDQPGMCLSPEYVELMKKHINITPFCETRCPYRRNGCPYYETKELIESYPQSWAGVHHHIPTYLQTFLFNTTYKNQQMFKHFDVLIIDEFPLQVLYHQDRIKRTHITDYRVVVERMIESNEKDFVLYFLELLLKPEIDYSRLLGLIMLNRGLDLKTFEKEYDTTLLRMISNKELDKAPKNLCHSIREIHKENPEMRKLKWMIYEIKGDQWSKPAILLTTSNVKYFKNIKIPIICLDATADIGAWNTLLNDNCRSETIDMEYKNLYQLRGGNYPVSSWVSQFNKYELSSTGERLCELIKEICKRKRKIVLICSNKRIRGLIRKYLKEKYDNDNYTFAIYYNLRGRNSFYEDCDTCIIAHEPNIPPYQFEIMENVIGWDAELLKDLMTTAEIKQAIGRIRQNILITPSGRIRDDIEIYVFPGGKNQNDKIVDESKIIPYEFMYSGNLSSLGGKIKELIKKSGKSIPKTNLYEALSKYCISRNSIDKELMKLYKEKYIMGYKRNIEWDFEEEKKRKEVKYRRKLSGIE